MLTSEALENYGDKFAEKVFTVCHVATGYMKAEDFFARGRPDGFHPGFDGSSGSALYDADGLYFSVYEWEMQPA